MSASSNINNDAKQNDPEGQTDKSPTVTATIITSIQPKVLAKTISIETKPNTKSKSQFLKKSTSAQLTQGTATKVHFSTLQEFSMIISSLKHNQAMTYGTTDHDKINIVTKRNVTDPQKAIARSKQYFTFPDGPGILMFDYDPQEDETPLSPDKLIEIIRTFPGFDDLALLHWSSASSNLHDELTGKQWSGLNGQRVYAIIDKASNIPAVSKVIKQFLWANGHGHIMIGNDGAMHVRSVFDQCVYEAERLDFISGAHCVPPLKQDRGKPVLYQSRKSSIDTDTDTKSTENQILKSWKVQNEKGTAERSKANEETAKADARPNANKVKSQYIQRRAEFIAGPKARPSQIRKCVDTIKKAMETKSLSSNFELIVIDKAGREIKADVKTIINDIDRFDQLRTLHPFEHNYRNREPACQLFLSEGKPSLFSFGHGNTRYILSGKSETIPFSYDDIDQCVIDTLSAMNNGTKFFNFGNNLTVINNDGDVVTLQAFHACQVIEGEFNYMTLRKKDLINVNFPKEAESRILAMGKNRFIKNLKEVVHNPVITRGGRIIQTEGYDIDSELFLKPKINEEFAPIPEAPALSAVLRAYKTIMNPFRAYKLAGPNDRGALLSAIITAVIRPMIRNSLAYGIDAPTQGSGKTYLALCLGAIKLGKRPTPIGFTGSKEEEISKTNLSYIHEGHTFLLHDNLKGYFDSANIAASITAGETSGRILGSTATASIPNLAMYVFTGNNLSLGSELTRRVAKIRIETDEETPYMVKFDFNPVKESLEQRQAIIAAVITLIHAFNLNRKHGNYKQRESLGGFEEWDDMVRKPILWLKSIIECEGEYEKHKSIVDEFFAETDDMIDGIRDINDPVKGILQNKDENVYTEDLADIILSCREIFGDEPFTSKQIEAICKRGQEDGWGEQSDTAEQETELYDTLLGIQRNDPRKLTSRSIGKILTYRKGSIIDGYRLDVVKKKDKSNRSNQFQITKMEKTQ